MFPRLKEPTQMPRHVRYVTEVNSGINCELKCYLALSAGCFANWYTFLYVQGRKNHNNFAENITNFGSCDNQAPMTCASLFLPFWQKKITKKCTQYAGLHWKMGPSKYEVEFTFLSNDIKFLSLPRLKVKGKPIPLQSWTSPEGSRRLRLPDFQTIGTWIWCVCQPYAPGAFTPQEIFLVLISVRGRIDSSATVRPEGLFQWRIAMTPSGITTRDIPACGAVPQPTAPPAACPQVKNWSTIYIVSSHLAQNTVFPLERQFGDSCMGK
jgi:hypothetical protein